VNINATLFGQAITFAILVWFTMKFVWPPIMKAMQERAQRIADGLAAADEGRRKFTQAEQLFQEKLTEGKQQSAVILAQAHKRGDEMIEEAKSTARVEGGHLLLEQVEQPAEIDVLGTPDLGQISHEMFPPAGTNRVRTPLW